MSFADLVAQPLGQGLKQTALLIHSLNKVDQTWLLQQLSPQERDDVLVLLNELQILGIPSDPDLLNGVISPVDAKPISDAADIESSNSYDGFKNPVRVEPFPLENEPTAEFVSRLEFADASILAEILRQEPAGLIARIFLIRNWPWQDALLEKLNANLRNQVKALLRMQSEATITPLLEKSLLLHFFQRYQKIWSSRQQQGQEATHRVLPIAQKGPLHAWLTRIRGIVK